MNILIVEDNPMFKKIMVNSINAIKTQGTKLNIIVQNNGIEAFIFIKDYGRKIDLIFTDFHMPIMDGLDFARAYREYFEEPVMVGHSTPIIMMTCNHEEVNSIDNLDITHCFAKPIKLDILKKIVYSYYQEDDMSHSNNKMTHI